MQEYKNSWDNYRQVYADKMDNLGEKQQQQIPRNVQSPKIEQERIFLKKTEPITSNKTEPVIRRIKKKKKTPNKQKVQNQKVSWVNSAKFLKKN